MELHTPIEMLRCGDGGFDEEEASQLLQRHADAAVRIAIAKHRLDAQACIRVLGFLNRMDRLTYLSLTDQCLTSESIVIIGDALRATPLAAPLPVSTLALESCGISDEDGAVLLRKLRDNPYIEQLFLSGNELALESCKALAECMAMQATNVFQVVQLGYNAITPDCMEALQVSISRHRRLQSLSLHGNLQLSDSGCAILCDSLRTDTLQMLNLAGTNLSGVDLPPLCRLIQESVVLVELILAQNYLSDEAIPPLSTALEESASLRSLDLSYNCFGTGESFALGECLARNKTMIQLSLAGNLLSSRTVEAIAAGLEHNHSLTALDFCRCCLNDDDLQALEEVKFVHVCQSITN
jgi:Ran GTPase-activating protein (RanGAP) involved in mRNA processing and transport